jgi:hypothetical protein
MNLIMRGIVVFSVKKVENTLKRGFILRGPIFENSHYVCIKLNNRKLIIRLKLLYFLFFKNENLYIYDYFQVNPYLKYYLRKHK